MQIGLYGRTSHETLVALATGVETLGGRGVFQRDTVFTPDQAKPFDAVVVRGETTVSRTIRRAYERRGTPVLIVDFPRIRCHDGAVYLGLGSLQWLPRTVPTDRLARLALPAAVPATGDAVLVLGQMPGDAAHGMEATALRTWYAAVATELRKRTDRPLLFRPHPLAPEVQPGGYDEILDPNAPLAEAFARTAWAYTYNSTAAVDAVIAGVPVAVADAHSYLAEALPVGLPSGDLAPLDLAVRTNFLARLAYTQWTLDELATAEPLTFLVRDQGERLPTNGVTTTPEEPQETEPVAGDPPAAAVAEPAASGESTPASDPEPVAPTPVPPKAPKAASRRRGGGGKGR